MNIGFSGVGNMSSAIIQGILNSGVAKPTSLHAYSPSAAQAHPQLQSSLQWHSSNRELAEQVDLLVLGVKPNVVSTVLTTLHGLTHIPLIVSLAAGVTLEAIEQLIGVPCAIVRAMPNTPASVGQGMTGLYCNNLTTPEQQDFVQQMFNGIGQVMWLAQEQQFHGLTAISGSGPAYYFQFTQGLIQAGIAQGFTEAQANTLAIQTAHGAGILMATSEKKPQQLQQDVTSKGGTTAAATDVLISCDLNKVVGQAVQAAAQRSADISQGNTFGD